MQNFFIALHCDWIIAEDFSSLAIEITGSLIHEGYILRTAGPPTANPIFERVALEVDEQMVIPFTPNLAAGNQTATDFLIKHDEDYWREISKSYVLPIRAHYGLALAGESFDLPSKFLLHIGIADKYQSSAIRIAKSLGIPTFDLTKDLEAFNKFMEQR